MKTFTKENYPAGYSRKDCQEQLETVTNQIESTKERLSSLIKEQKELQKQLKQGGED